MSNPSNNQSPENRNGSRRLIVGVNDLASTHPEVASLWNPRNIFTPQEVKAGSERKVWWKHPVCNHEWQAVIGDTVQKAKGCPFCSNRRVLVGFNDLETKNPELAAMWDYDKNTGLTPQMVVDGSAKKVSWKCSEGHEWESPIRDHLRCQVCAHRKVLTGFNDITITAPEIAQQFHPVKNGEIRADSLLAGHVKNVWWLDEACGHEWEASPYSRIKLASGCPVCVNQKVIAGVNDLATVSPKLAAEWHPEKNGTLEPSHVSVGSGKKVWWLCEKKHTWRSAVLNRKTRGCPYCSGNKVLLGYNDLETIVKDIAGEWDYEKNYPLTPKDVSVGANKRIWWKCIKEHSWQAFINDRTRTNATGCPVCVANCYVSKAEQEIADFLREHGLVIEQSNRRVLKGVELDIYIPSHNFAIEYNGLYWHSEKFGKGKNHHLSKYLAAKDNGIQLVQIWEDDWNKNPEQIKAMLLHKLGLSQQSKIFARKTLVKELAKKHVEAFLENNHIQGFASGSHYLGLFEKNSETLVSVIVLKKEANHTLNIIRYATSKNVVGGFTKLLTYAEKNYAPERFITFSDHCVSDGGLYANNGFISDKELNPDYRYLAGGKRQHKFGYRLKRFRNDPALKWEEGLTEKELAALNGLYRIWDAGKTRWVRYTTK